MTKPRMWMALIVIILAGILLGFGRNQSRHATAAGTPFYRMEAEAMTRSGAAGVPADPTASGGYAVKAWMNASGVGGSATFSTTGAYVFTFGGREDYYAGLDGAHAHVSVYLDGATAPAGSVYVTNTSGYLPYTIAVPVSAGTHSFQMFFDNDAYGGSSSTDRNAYIDYVAVAPATDTATNTPVPPTNTPSLPTATSTPATTNPTATPTPGDPTGTTLFSGGFESGNFSGWSLVKTGGDGTATVQSSVVKSGSYAAQLSETSTAGSYAFANAPLTAAQTDLTVSGDFDTTVQGASDSNVRFFRLYDPSGALVVSLYRQNGSSGAVWLQYPAGGAYYSTSGTVVLNTWAHVELHVVTVGSGASTVQVWLDGSQIYQTTTASLGKAGVQAVQIGHDVAGQTFTQVVDNVTVSSGSPVATPAATSSTTAPTATNTSVPPSDTSVPPAATDTPALPTNTAVPPAVTDTAVPPAVTDTAVPPAVTDTAVPPTNTAVPPGSTSVPATPAPLSGPAYYVDCTSGADTNSGTSPTAAWQSLSKANTAPLVPGASLLFRRGCTWTGTLTVSGSGTATQNIVVGAFGTGTLPKIQSNVSGYAVVSLTGSYVTVDSLFAQGIAPSVESGCQYNPKGWIVGFELKTGAHDDTVRNSQASGAWAGVDVDGGSYHNAILNNQLVDNNMMSPLTSGGNDDAGAFGVVLHGDDNVVAHNTISGSHACSYDYKTDGSAVEVYGGQGNTIQYNTAVDDQAFSELGNARSANNTYAYNLYRSALPDAIFLTTRGANDSFGPVNGTKLYNNTAYLTGSASEGVVCYAGCNSTILTMRNNIIQAVAKVGYADASFSEDYDLFYGGPTQFAVGAHSKVADPLFVSAATSDFQLQPGSPGINAGTSLGYTTDLADHPVTSPPNVGAYQS